MKNTHSTGIYIYERTRIHTGFTSFIYMLWLLHISLHFLGYEMLWNISLCNTKLYRLYFGKAPTAWKQFCKIFVTRFQRCSPYWMGTVDTCILSTLEFCTRITEYIFHKVLNFVGYFGFYYYYGCCCYYSYFYYGNMELTFL